MEKSALGPLLATAKDVLPEILHCLGLKDASGLRLVCREARDLVRERPWDDRYTRVAGKLRCEVFPDEGVGSSPVTCCLYTRLTVWFARAGSGGAASRRPWPPM
jgi:hypothetical protein